MSKSRFFQKILNLYQFFPKNKYVEELLDTDDSDVTGEEDKDATTHPKIFYLN